MEKPCEFCGKPFAVTHNRKRFCSTKCRAQVLPPPSRKVCLGTRHKVAEGYIEIKTENGWMLEHIYIMEQVLGRPIDRRKEMVHHLNHIRDDNRPENLQVMNRGDHIWHHRRLNAMS